jgi:hypothetical protein
MKKVKFTTDFAVKRVGDVVSYDTQLASQLVNVDKVAEYTDEDITETESDREHIEPNLIVENSEEITEEETVNVDKVVKKASKKTK